jgi:diazepam-binding inhibitor (GABA receptor modulator, acyl-CoA-binding protein)
LGKDMPQLQPHEKDQLYGLFNQATKGDNQTPAPSQYSHEHIRWKAYENCKGMKKEEAMEAYTKIIKDSKK